MAFLYKVFFTLKSAVFLFVLFIIITCILFFSIHLEVPFCGVCCADDTERVVLEKAASIFKKRINPIISEHERLILIEAYLRLRESKEILASQPEVNLELSQIDKTQTRFYNKMLLVGCIVVLTYVLRYQD